MRQKIEVVSDVSNENWRIRSRGKLLGRTRTKDIALSRAVSLARSSGAPILLEIRRINGQFQEYRSYNG